MEALNQIQSWLNAGNFEKVIQGCQEILEIEPGNQRALSLLKQAEEKRHNEEQIPQDIPMDPLANLAVEEDKTEEEVKPEPKPEPKAEPETAPEPEHNYDFYTPPRPSKKKMFLAMVIPAIAVVLIGGFFVNMMNNANRDQILANNDKAQEYITDHDHSNDPEPDTSYLSENEQRVTDLTEMADAIEEFWFDNGHFPSHKDVEQLIQNEIGRIPSDPRQGETDASGDPYGYMYALYDLNGVEDGAYILSAIFQDSKGEAHAWAQGASTKNYDDYRLIDASHVSYIGN